MASAKSHKVEYIFSLSLGLLILALLAYALLTGEINDLDKYSAAKVTLEDQPLEYWTSVTVFFLIDVVVFVAAWWSRNQMLIKTPPEKRGSR